MYLIIWGALVSLHPTPHRASLTDVKLVLFQYDEYMSFIKVEFVFVCSVSDGRSNSCCAEMISVNV